MHTSDTKLPAGLLLFSQRNAFKQGRGNEREKEGTSEGGCFLRKEGKSRWISYKEPVIS